MIARREDKLKETEDQCTGPSKLVFSGDVTDQHFIQTSFQQAFSVFGRIDLVFNNAGIAPRPTPIEEMTLETFRQTVDVNLIGPFLCTREAVRIFKTQEPNGGRIINNGSISARVPRVHAVAYATTKHAITGLTKSTVLDGRKYNITATQLDVGNTRSEMTSPYSAGMTQADNRTMIEPLMDVEDVANTIVYIASLPNSTTMLEVTVLPTEQPFVGRG